MDAAGSVRPRQPLSSVFARGPSTIVLVMVAVAVAGGAYDPRYLSGTNLYLLSRQIALVYVAALGQFLVVLSRGMDLSIGAVAGLSGMVVAWAMQSGVPPPVAVPLALLVGVTVGFANGMLVGYLRLDPCVATIGTGQLVSGLTLGLSRGWSVVEVPRSFLVLAQGAFLGAPVPVWASLLLGLVAHVALAHMAFGRRLVAMALNEQATFLSGIDVNRIKFLLYVISAGFASVSGIMLVSRYASSQPDIGKGWELDAIAAAVIGGTSLAGGSGSVLGVIIGACIMAVLRNGLVLMKVDPYWHISIIGVVIVLAAVLDVKTKRS